MTERHWHEDRMVQPRHSNPPGGVDHGSTGTVLAEVRHGNDVALRLVWFKGYMRPAAGVRGFGHIYSEAQLEVINRGGYWQASILKGGRISRKRLAEHAAAIDEAMGAGVASLLYPTKTLVVVRDVPGGGERGERL